MERKPNLFNFNFYIKSEKLDVISYKYCRHVSYYNSFIAILGILRNVLHNFKNFPSLGFTEGV